MTTENFCYWLQGFFEMTNSEELTLEQVKMVKDHLSFVFTGVVAPIIIPETTTSIQPREPDALLERYIKNRDEGHYC